MTEPTTPETVTELVLLVLDVYGELHSHGKKITSPYGQSPARWQVMGQISNDDLTVSQIARRIGNSRQAVQRLADEMANAGIVEFVGNPDHRRSLKLKLTAEGAAVFRKINSSQKKWATRLGQEISPTLAKQTIRGLRQLAEGLQG